MSTGINGHWLQLFAHKGKSPMTGNHRSGALDEKMNRRICAAPLVISTGRGNGRERTDDFHRVCRLEPGQGAFSRLYG
jgi:hypothetical protein